MGMYKTTTIRVDQEFINMAERMAIAANRSRGALMRDVIYWLAIHPDEFEKMLDDLPRYKEATDERSD